jgi:branched-chain amino acid transport system ATP-binding protein
VNRLAIENLEAGYGAVSVLHGVSLEVRAGELVALLGTNGNGKSTLLNAVMGIVKPKAGRVLLEWDGESLDLTGSPTHRVVEAGIAFVPEGRRLVPHLTVEENLRLAGGSARARPEAEANLSRCFKRFSVLRERRNQRADTLSGGQQQLVAIARALMTNPRIVVVDEPSVGLAPIVVDQVIAAIRELLETGLTVLIAEQSFFQAIDVATRAYILSHGAIVGELDRGSEAIALDEIRLAMLGVTA